MGWSRGWSVAKFAQGFDRSSNDAFDIVALSRWHQYWSEEIHLGVCVDAPNYEQLHLLGKVASLLPTLEWSGKAEDVLGVLGQLSNHLEVDALARSAVEGGPGGKGGISIGGVARCEGVRLVAFRLGTFRVLVDGSEVLPEQTMLREGLQRGNAIPDQLRSLLQPASVCLPSQRLGPEDLIVVEPYGPPVRVLHAKELLPGEMPQPRIDISASWVGC